jgi:hypothetical protein
MIHPAINVLDNLRAFDKLPITLHRINIDIPWNTSEANNLAIDNCNYEHICRFDLDHYFCNYEMKKLLAYITKKHSYFSTFCRKKNDKHINPSMSAFVMHKTIFNTLGGFNEYFSGDYGWDDIDFYQRASEITNRQQIDVCIEVNPIFKAPGLQREPSVNEKKLKTQNDHFFGKCMKNITHYILHSLCKAIDIHTIIITHIIVNIVIQTNFLVLITVWSTKD